MIKMKQEEVWDEFLATGYTSENSFKINNYHPIFITDYTADGKLFHFLSITFLIKVIRPSFTQVR